MYEDWTEEEIMARINDIEDELEELFGEIGLLDEVDFADEIAYLVDEGFIEVEEVRTEDGQVDFCFYPVGQPEYIEIPI